MKTVQLGFSVQYYRFDELMTALRTDAELPPNRLKRRKYMSTALPIVDGEPCQAATGPRPVANGFEAMCREEASVRRRA